MLCGNDKVNNKYMFYFCQSKYLVGELMKVATGASYPAVKTSGVLNVMISDLKIAEQDDVSLNVSKGFDLNLNMIGNKDKINKLCHLKVISTWYDLLLCNIILLTSRT